MEENLPSWDKETPWTNLVLYKSMTDMAKDLGFEYQSRKTGKEHLSIDLVWRNPGEMTNITVAIENEA